MAIPMRFSSLLLRYKYCDATRGGPGLNSSHEYSPWGGRPPVQCLSLRSTTTVVRDCAESARARAQSDPHRRRSTGRWISAGARRWRHNLRISHPPDRCGMGPRLATGWWWRGAIPSARVRSGRVTLLTSGRCRWRCRASTDRRTRPTVRGLPSRSRRRCAHRNATGRAID